MKEAVLNLLRSGLTEGEIVALDGFPDRATILQWCEEDDDFKVEYDKARLLYYNIFADKLNAAATLLLDPDSGATKVYADKVKRALEVFQVTAAKQAPAVYGPKTTGATVGIGGDGKNMNITVEFVDAEPVTDAE